MADAEPAVGEDAASQRAAEQARRRKERREAKIRAGGADRLSKITGLGGGVQRDTPTVPPEPGPPGSPDSAAKHPDPEEVVLSEHHYEPRRTHRHEQVPRLMEEPDPELLRQFMGITPPSSGMGTPLNGEPNLFRDFDKIMSQILGGGGSGGGGGMQPAQQPPSSQSTYIWRLVHAVFALALGLYVAFATPFSGTEAERRLADAGELPDHVPRNFFVIFGSVEALLLTTRFFMAGGRYVPQGVLGTVIELLPEPYRGYLTVVLRYGQIFMTVRADLLACVFVLGVCSWLRSW